MPGHPLLEKAIPLLLVFTLAACADRDAEDPAAGEDAAATDVQRAGPAQAQLPDTTAEAVWAYLQEQDYQSWALFPGKDEIYPGSEPHGAFLTTYVNETAANALRQASSSGGNVRFEPGSFVIKENLMPDSSFAAVTVMYKTADFAMEDQDGWWFMKRNADGSLDAAGRGQGCANCHGGARNNDYLMTSLPAQTGSDR